METAPSKALTCIVDNYGNDAGQLSKQLASHAWLEGWIAAMTWLREPNGQLLTAPKNPYLED